MAAEVKQERSGMTSPRDYKFINLNPVNKRPSGTYT